MKHIHVLAALAAAAIGCGGNGPATSRNNPGTGSSTLNVTADIDASGTSTSPVTDFTIRVRDGAGNNVTDATVAIGNASLSGGAMALPWSAAAARYTGSVTAWPTGDFSLSITRGTDNVQGVVVGNPGMHTINAPVVNSTVAPNQPLVVSWTTPTQAKQMTISTRDMSFSGPDVGAYTIEAASNPTRVNQRVIVERYNEVEAAGGLLGSRLNVTYTATVDPFNVQ